MVTKHQIKLINSLAQKKYRQQHKLFVVEGIKGISEFINSSFKLHSLYTTKAIFDAPKERTFEITEKELRKISSLKNPNVALAIFNSPESSKPKQEGLIIALDDVRDPGNLGTIIRLCDWYGVSDLICSTTTVECYNPKVVQATMGSLTRVNVNYTDLEQFLKTSNTEVFGTFMEGENIYKQSLPEHGIVVLGNEANGISDVIESFINQKISIPRFGKIQSTESLNVANATAIVLSEFRRHTIEM
ncbi:TrmH family RNA methyltransferase [Winogradskyella sp.]|uniref:TrmH family RNA methyltransferase n=1 Tax=Winogradskyella sp. TaxID=1883156 RepID=UPI003F6C55D2